MPRPYTRAQALQNAAFLRRLSETGNAREAARELNLNRSMLTKRRHADPAFAARWEAALVVAAGRLSDPAVPSGEGRLVRSGGRLQLRAPSAKVRHIDIAAEQRFLAALCATANVRLAAAATGFAHSSFYARARANPGFAREMRLAIALGCERLEMALLEDGMPESNTHDQWRHNDPPPIPPMTAAEALQALAMHARREERLVNPDWHPRRRLESDDAWSERQWKAARIRRMVEEEESLMMEYAQREAHAERSPFEPSDPLADIVTQALAEVRRVRARKEKRVGGEAPEGKGLFGGKGFGTGGVRSE